MKKLLYVCEADSGGIMEYAIRQSAAIAKEGVEVHFLCKPSFPVERLADGIKVWQFDKSRGPSVQRRGLAGKILRVLRMISDLRSEARQVAELATKLAQTSSTRHPLPATRYSVEDASHQLPVTRQDLGEAEVAVLFACYKEYFAPFWVPPLRGLARQGVVIGTIAHDPVRDFVVGPLWWHQWSVRLGYSFVRHVFVHDDTPVDFGGKQPEGIQIHQIPHGPYEVAEPKIGRLEMRRKLGFSSDLTTEDTTERLGGREMEQPKVGPKGEGVGTTESKSTEEAAGPCLDKPSGAAFSNPSTSELARDSETTSRISSADGLGGARIALGGTGSVGGNQLADSGEFLEGQSQAGLQIGSQKYPTPRAAMGSDTSGDNSSSVSISVISGEKTSVAPEAPSPATSHSPPITAPQASSASLPATSHSPLATPAPPDVVFLAFGQIRDGKNLDLFLRAMTRLPANVKLLVAGKGDSGSSRPPEFYQNLAEELGVGDRCRWDIRRIPDEEVGDIFAACDVVLVTYSAKFRSASGVLNVAVSGRKPVLASSGAGPLKTVVGKYQLGVFVEPDDLEDILRGASKLVSSSATGKCEFVLKPDWERYERENSWEENAKRVVERIKK